MFLLFLPIVYALYDQETMLETSLRSEVIQARAYHEYVHRVTDSIVSHRWSTKDISTADEMFRMTLPMLQGMSLSLFELHNQSHRLIDTVESCGELYDYGVERKDQFMSYFSDIAVDVDIQSDVNDSYLQMEEDLRFIDDLCTSAYEVVEQLYEMAHSYADWSEILLTRAMETLEDYRNKEDALHVSNPKRVNYTEAKMNYSSMQELANVIHTIHTNLTLKEKDSI